MGSTVDSDHINWCCGTCSGLYRFYSSCSEKCPCIWFCSFLQVYLLTLALLTRALGHARKLNLSLSLCFPLSQGLVPIKSHTHPWLGQVSGAEAGERCLLVPTTGWWVCIPCAQCQEMSHPARQIDGQSCREGAAWEAWGGMSKVRGLYHCDGNWAFKPL